MHENDMNSFIPLKEQARELARARREAWERSLNITRMITEATRLPDDTRKAIRERERRSSELARKRIDAARMRQTMPRRR